MTAYGCMRCYYSSKIIPWPVRAHYHLHIFLDGTTSLTSGMIKICGLLFGLLWDVESRSEICKSREAWTHREKHIPLLPKLKETTSSDMKAHGSQRWIRICALWFGFRIYKTTKKSWAWYENISEILKTQIRQQVSSTFPSHGLVGAIASSYTHILLWCWIWPDKPREDHLKKHSRFMSDSSLSRSLNSCAHY